MTDTRSPRHTRALGIGALAAAAVFVVDLALPPGFAVHFGYVAVALSSLWWPSRRAIVLGAAGTTGLVLLGTLASHEGGNTGMSYVNRPQTIALIWVATGLVLRYRHTARRVEDLARIIETSADAIAGVAEDGTIRNWNAGAERLFGQSGSAALGQPVSGLFAPGEAVRVMGTATRAQEGEAPDAFDTVCLGADGRRINVSARISPLADPWGRPAGWSLILRDTTDRVRAEAQARQVRELETELAHASRVVTTSELATSIAHEINQPLAGVVANGDACMRWLNAQPPRLAEVRASVRHMMEDARRVSEVVSRVRLMLRKAQPEARDYDLNELVRETVALTQRLAASSGASVRTELGEHLPAVRGDRVQLQQVLVNLVMNAVEATAQAADGPREVVVRSDRVAPDGVSVTVTDSGPGIAEELGDRIFDAFYTTKPAGLGLGLTISRSIVERVGGRIAVRGGGPGGCVQLWLPVSDARTDGA